MLVSSLFALGAATTLTFACPQHDNNAPMHTKKRAEPANASELTDWAYEASYNWGKINTAYALCQTGTQQAPIALFLSNGLSLNHRPTFSYPKSVTGNFYNWGYGPAFTVASNGSYTSSPSFSYDNETVYLKGWHIHAPADHSVSGVRSKAEMHFVHVNAAGKEKAVLAFRLDPGNANSTFFDQLHGMIGFKDTGSQEEVTLDLTAALDGVQHFNEFWTYQGSLTSPPCTEGIRFFVARTLMLTGVEKMQDILGASTYSARAEQQVWLHRINE